jgi:peptidylamidoglycolate lyase
VSVTLRRPGRIKRFLCSSFNSTNHFQQLHLGPIPEHTVLTLDPQNGRVLGRWGDNLFYMPHGLTIDRHDNLWVTDVALHQAFKFKPGELTPVLTFGQRFVPGSSKNHLCMPTSIAVASEGEVFIADGYCNSRILKFNAAGVLLRVIPNPPGLSPPPPKHKLKVSF